MNTKIYIVIAKRWGEDETHSYLCGTNGADLKDPEAEKKINEVLLPKLFKRIEEILTVE